MFDILQLLWVLVVPVEIGLLFFFYKYYFAEYNSRKWIEIAEKENFLVEILDPVIETICVDVSDTMMNRIQNELLSNQGTLTRLNQNPENENEIGLMMAQKVLNEMGMKKINPILALRMANGLKNILKKPSQNNEPNESENLIKGPIL
jgi:hypothetical protein